jgi:hypothetical protein
VPVLWRTRRKGGEFNALQHKIDFLSLVQYDAFESYHYNTILTFNVCLKLSWVWSSHNGWAIFFELCRALQTSGFVFCISMWSASDEHLKIVRSRLHMKSDDGRSLCRIIRTKKIKGWVFFLKNLLDEFDIFSNVASILLKVYLKFFT